MKLNDKSQVKFKLTDQGYLISEGVKLARVGAMEYLGSELGKDPKKVYDVYVDAEQLFNPETMRSFEHTPITIQHPEEMEVNSKNWEELAVGHISNIRPSGDRQFLIGDSIVNSPRAISTIQSGVIEVSCGYDADIEEVDGKLTKVNIRGNHLAIVDEGRCGADCKINLNDGKPKKMAQKQTALQRLFGIKPKAKATKKFGDAKSKLATRTKKLNDSKADFDVKFKDVEEIVVSPDATDEEKLEAVQELQTAAADLQEEAIAIQEEAVAAVEQAEELAAQVTPADEETPVNDATVEEAAAEVAALQEEILEKDAKILELEEQLQALKDKEDQASSLNDAKASFAKVVFKDSMSAKEIKATAVASTGAYSFADAMKLQDCALNSAYAAAKTVHGKKSNVGAKFVGNDNKAKANVPASLRRKEK